MATTATYKDTKGKLRMDLIPPDCEQAIAEVLTFGATKYGDRSWEEGIQAQQLMAALRRHLLQWQLGHRLDEESGLSHLKHALTNLAMLTTLEARGKM
jgi:hypothetical protein